MSAGVRVTDTVGNGVGLRREPGAPPWWALRAHLRRWWLARLPASDALALTHRNVYILPTRAGLMLAATVLTLLVASINYQLNLGYLLTFLLAGSASAGMVIGHNTLRGLQLHLLPPQPLFAGRRATLEVELINARRSPRYAVGMALEGGRNWAWADVPAGGRSRLQVAFQPQRRGLYPVPMLRAETRFPLGAFRVWAPWRPASRVLVYPAPEMDAPPLPRGTPQGGTGTLAHAHGGGEFDGVRDYRHGDPLKLVVWKKFARSGELIVRDTEQLQRHTLWLDLAQTGAMEREAGLSRLTAWVLEADARGLDYGLRLPGLEIAPDHGHDQRLRCLRALATC